mgnify:CR=1 FL=1
MIARTKHNLRARLRQARKSISGPQRARATKAINRRLLELSLPKSVATVGVYAAIGSEVCIDEAIQHWIAAGHRIAWPRVEGAGDMVFCCAGPDSLVLSSMGIKEPSLEHPIVPIETMDLLVVPGIGFDRFGGRLGQGGGFYDRALAEHDSSLRTVGVAFSVQVTPLIPTETTDRQVGIVLTERGLARAGRWSL